ncbi:MAG: NAD(P)-binding domain-containing protein, partial [Arenimonas sp.]
MKIGFIGLGAMGEPMAGHLHAQHLLTVVGNRNIVKAQILAEKLGVNVARASSYFSDCDIVVLCVSKDADVLENVEALATVLKAGAVIVDHSTVSMETAKQAQ